MNSTSNSTTNQTQGSQSDSSVSGFNSGLGEDSSVNGDQAYNPPPDLFLQRIDTKGIVTVKFTKPMIVPENLTSINDSGLGITVNAEDYERQPDLLFTWKTIEFTSELLAI